MHLKSTLKFIEATLDNALQLQTRLHEYYMRLCCCCRDDIFVWGFGFHFTLDTLPSMTWNCMHCAANQMGSFVPQLLERFFDRFYAVCRLFLRTSKYLIHFYYGSCWRSCCSLLLHFFLIGRKQRHLYCKRLDLTLIKEVTQIPHAPETSAICVKLLYACSQFSTMKLLLIKMLFTSCYRDYLPWVTVNFNKW